jgi:signal peptidase I
MSKSFFKWYKERKALHKQKKKQETFPEKIVSFLKTLIGAIIIVMIINGLAIASFVVPTGSMENTVMAGDFLFVNKFIYGPSTPQVIPFLNIPLPFYKFPGIKKPERGDVIVFIYPGDRDQIEPSEFQYYLKRCVAISGDTVQIINKQLYVNGNKIALAPEGKFESNRIVDIADRARTFPYNKGYTRDNYGPLRVPKKGDNINLSKENIHEWLIFIQREGHSVAMTGNQILIDGKPTNTYTVEKDYCFGMGDNRDNSLDSRYWGFIPVDNVVGSPLIVYWSWPMRDAFERELSLIDKIKNIRWSRIFTFID